MFLCLRYQPEPQQAEPSVWNAAFRQNNLLAGMFRPAKQFEPAKGITLILIRMKFMAMSNGDRCSLILSHQRKPPGLKTN
jgi:hypothetical protein